MTRTALFAFAAIYIIWGSTYLAIRTAVESLPPWGLSSVRFFIAGAIMWAIARARREGPLTREQKRVALISGPCLVVANGVVCVVERWIPSGVTAVVIGAMPIWTLLLGWAAFRQARPTARKIAGSFIGLFGIALIASGDIDIAPAPDGGGLSIGLGSLFLISSGWLWTCGTLVQRPLGKVESGFLFTAYQMLWGAGAVGLLSLASEKPWTIPWQTVTWASLGAFAYLVIFGSIVGFSAYTWLSRNVEPHLVSTYALVNPLIAVALGALVYDEAISSRFAAAAALVAVGLGLLVLKGRARTT